MVPDPGPLKKVPDPDPTGSSSLVRIRVVFKGQIRILLFFTVRFGFGFLSRKSDPGKIQPDSQPCFEVYQVYIDVYLGTGDSGTGCCCLAADSSSGSFSMRRSCTFFTLKTKRVIDRDLSPRFWIRSEQLYLYSKFQ